MKYWKGCEMKWCIFSFCTNILLEAGSISGTCLAWIQSAFLLNKNWIYDCLASLIPVAFTNYIRVFTNEWCSFKSKQEIYFSPYTGKTYTVSSGNCPSFSCATRSSLARAYCGAAGPVSKMASQQEKAFCVLRFEVSRSVITVHETHAAL